MLVVDLGIVIFCIVIDIFVLCFFLFCVLCVCCLEGGTAWDSLADLLKIMKLRGVVADDVKEVREIVQHLFANIVKPARSKRDSRQAKTHVENLLL